MTTASTHIESPWIRLLDRFGLPTALVIVFLFGGWRMGGLLVETHREYMVSQIEVSRAQSETLRELAGLHKQMASAMDNLSRDQNRTRELLESQVEWLKRK